MLQTKFDLLWGVRDAAKANVFKECNLAQRCPHKIRHVTLNRETQLAQKLDVPLDVTRLPMLLKRPRASELNKLDNRKGKKSFSKYLQKRRERLIVRIPNALLRCPRMSKMTFPQHRFVVQFSGPHPVVTGFGGVRSRIAKN